MAPISDRDIRELAGFSGSQAPVTSCYLDVDGRRHVRRQDYEAHLDDLLRRARNGSVANGRAGHPSVQSDLARISEHVRGGLDRSRTKGLAMFSCSADGLWRVFELAVPVRNQICIEPTPSVRQLETVFEQYERFGVLLVDRQRARMLVFQLGELVDKTEQFDSLPRHDDDGGDLTKDQVAGYSAAAVQRHLRRAAEVAFHVYQEQGFDHLVLGGPDDVLTPLEKQLHSYLRERIAARLSIPATASDDDILRATLEVESSVERAKEAAEVEHLRAGLARGKAVVGIEPVLKALAERRVDTLLVSEGFDAPGWRCLSCGHIGVVGRSCPLCSASMDPVADVVEQAVEEALSQSCRVRMCIDNADLDVLGRVGAIVRY